MDRLLLLLQPHYSLTTLMDRLLLLLQPHHTDGPAGHGDVCDRWMS